LDLLSRPVELGLGHSVSKIDVLGPCLLGISSTLDVKVGVILEDSGLGNISLVVGGLLALFTLSDVAVLLGVQARWDIRLCCDLTNFQLQKPLFKIESKRIRSMLDAM